VFRRSEDTRRGKVGRQGTEQLKNARKKVHDARTDKKSNCDSCKSGADGGKSHAPQVGAKKERERN